MPYWDLLGEVEQKGFYIRRIATYLYAAGLTLILPASLPDSILFAKVTLLPNRQYRGIFTPTTPDTTDPVWMPMRICRGTFSGETTCAADSIMERAINAIR
jgi:hypothetical protein